MYPALPPPVVDTAPIGMVPHLGQPNSSAMVRGHYAVWRCGGVLRGDVHEVGGLAPLFVVGGFHGGLLV